MNNISIGGVQPDKNTGAYMPAAPETGTYQNPANTFQNKNVNTGNMGFDAPNMDPKAGAFDYNPTASGGLSFEQHGLNLQGAGVNLDHTKPTFDPSQSFISDDALVEKRLTDLLSDDNPYVKLNELKAQQAMNAKGGLNTSMAATAGRAAAIEAGLDIAKQDASTYAQADLARQSSTYQGGLSQQQGEITGALDTHKADLAGRQTDQQKAYEFDTRVQQGAISGDLKQQDLAGQAEQTRLQGLQQGALAEQQGRITGELNTQQAAYKQQNDQFQGQVNAALQNLQDTNESKQLVFKETMGLITNRMQLEQNRVIEQAKLNEQQREAFGTMMTQMAKDYEVSVQNILINENLDKAGKQHAIAAITSIFNQDMTNISNIFGVRTTAINSGDAGSGATSTPPPA